MGTRQASLIRTLALAVLAASPDDATLRSLPLGSFVDASSLEQLANMVVTDTKVAQSPNSVTQEIVVLRSDDGVGNERSDYTQQA